MTDDRIDHAALRAALRTARRQRAELRATTPATPDTAHVILRPLGEPALDVVMLRFPDSPYAGPPGRPSYRSLRDLGQVLRGMAAAPPTPRRAAGTQPDGGYELVAIAFAHAVPGCGAELLVDARRDAQGVLEWTLSRAPSDGAPIEIGRDFDDAVFEREFGRALTLAARWQPVLAEAMAGRTNVFQIEPGYWIYAAPRGDASLAMRIAEHTGTLRSFTRVALGVADRAGLAALEPGYAQWAPEAASAMRSGAIEAGAIVDLAAAREQLEAIIERRGFELVEYATTGELFARDGEVHWPLDPALLSTAAVHLARGLTETAATLGAVTASNLAKAKQYVAALRAARSGHTVTVHKTVARPTRPDGTHGEPLDLRTLPFSAPVATPAFEREVRFAFDRLGAGSDMARVCTCGAPARLVTRLLPWSAIQDTRAWLVAPGPRVMAQWPAERPRCGAVIAVACAAHVRIPSADELDRAGISGDALRERLSEALPGAAFQLTASLQRDASGHPVLIAHGPAAASIALHDALLRGLDVACGSPLAGRETRVEAVPPDGLCVFDRSLESSMLDLIVRRLNELDGAAAPYSVGWPARLDVAPCGSFELTRTGAPLPSGMPWIQPADASIRELTRDE